MQIWVDADACPNVIKEILFRAAERQKIEVILVANQALRVPRSPFIKTKQVGTGFDVADNYIANFRHFLFKREKKHFCKCRFPARFYFEQKCK